MQLPSLVLLLWPLLVRGVPVDHLQELLKPLHLWHEHGKDVYEVRKELQKAEIIPTVLPDFLPTSTLDAEWTPIDHALLGNTLPPAHLLLRPGITLTQSPSQPSNGRDAALEGCIRANMTYAIVMTDPDAPSRDDPRWAEFCHWIATGVPLSTSETGCARLELARLHDVVEYKGPAPPQRTGKHRYVLLAFAPANGTTEPLHLTTPTDRKQWGRKGGLLRGPGAWDWAQENGLIPVAANFIYAQNWKQ